MVALFPWRSRSTKRPTRPAPATVERLAATTDRGAEVAPTRPDGSGADEPQPLGELVLDRPLPGRVAFRAAATPGTTAGSGTAPWGGPSALDAGPGCHNQCITTGLAYARGFGAELVIRTNVDARLWVSVVTADEEYFNVTTTGMTDHLSWTLDDLEPGTTYEALVGATDAHDNTSYAWGSFTTLSERRVEVAVGGVTITGGPEDVSATGIWSQADGGTAHEHSSGAGAPLVIDDADAQLDLDLWVLRHWDDDLCESWGPIQGTTPPQGHSTDACLAWNSASQDDITLDVVPDGQHRWSQVSFTTTLTTPTGAGGALPAGYGDPHHFRFSAPMTVTVSYR